MDMEIIIETRKQLVEQIRAKEKELTELKKTVAGQEERLNHLQSSLFNLANYYFVFQGVILTVVCNGSSSLRRSECWFLFSLTVLAALLNLVAFFSTGIKYNTTKAEQGEINSQLHTLQAECDTLQEKLKQSPQSQPNGVSQNSPRNYQPRPKYNLRHNLYLIVCMVIFLGFTGVVLVGCWKIVRRENVSDNLPSSGKRIRLCDGLKCLSICSNY